MFVLRVQGATVSTSVRPEYSPIAASEVCKGRTFELTKGSSDLFYTSVSYPLLTTRIMILTHLVTIGPWVVLAPDVLVRVLDSLLERRHVGFVLPMLNPQVIGIESSKD